GPPAARRTDLGQRAVHAVGLDIGHRRTRSRRPGDRPGEDRGRGDDDRLAANRARRLDLLHAGWIFCTPNTLTETTEEHLPRTQRARAERAGHRASPVRVVSVSRKASSTTARS